MSAFKLAFNLAAYLAAFMLVAMDVDIKSAPLGGIVLRIGQLRAAWNRPLVLTGLFQGDDRLAGFAGGRIMDMHARSLDVDNRDLALDTVAKKLGIFADLGRNIVITHLLLYMRRNPSLARLFDGFAGWPHAGIITRNIFPVQSRRRGALSTPPTKWK